MEPTKKAAGFAQFIPQLTYDVIARIVPGVLLLAAVSIFWGDSIPSGGGLPLIDSSRLWNLGNVPGIILIAYFGAQIFETIWYAFVEPRIETQYRKMEGEVKELVVTDLRNMKGAEDLTPESCEFPGIAFIYDSIRLKNPIAGSRIVKIRAEVQMYRTAFLGVLFITLGLCIENVFLDRTFHQKPFQSFIVLIGMGLFCLALFAQASYRRRRLVWSLYNHWLLLVDPRFARILDA